MVIEIQMCSYMHTNDNLEFQSRHVQPHNHTHTHIMLWLKRHFTPVAFIFTSTRGILTSLILPVWNSRLPASRIHYPGASLVLHIYCGEMFPAHMQPVPPWLYPSVLICLHPHPGIIGPNYFSGLRSGCPPGLHGFLCRSCSCCCMLGGREAMLVFWLRGPCEPHKNLPVTTMVKWKPHFQPNKWEHL
jgi:hypothetical protein